MGFFDQFQQRVQQDYAPNPNGNPYQQMIGNRTPTAADYNNLSPEGQAWARSQAVREPGAGTTQPIGPRPTDTGQQDPRDPAYIDAQITAGFQQRYGRPPSPEELQQWRGYAAGDTYSDGRYRVGWNPYLNDRLVNPASAGGSGVDPGMETVVAGGGPNNGGMGGGGQFPGFSQTGVNGLASFDAPGINKPFTQQFSFNPSDIANSEVYQFARDEGLNAVNRGHAAAGTFNTGGALKDLMKYASGNAAQAYGDEFNRRYGVYAGDKDTYFRNADSTFNRLNSLAQYGAGAAGKYADSVSSIYGQQGNVNAARAGNPPWWQGGVNAGITAGADALFNRTPRPPSPTGSMGGGGGG